MSIMPTLLMAVSFGCEIMMSAHGIWSGIPASVASDQGCSLDADQIEGRARRHLGHALAENAGVISAKKYESYWIVIFQTNDAHKERPGAGAVAVMSDLCGENISRITLP